MWASSVIKAQVSADGRPSLADRVVGVKIDLLLFLGDVPGRGVGLRLLHLRRNVERRQAQFISHRQPLRINRISVP